MTGNSDILLVGGMGYIGSYLAERLTAEGQRFDICDLGWRGFPAGQTLFRQDYATLTPETLARYRLVFWFGGHSSVGAALRDPQGALTNNCVHLLSLRRAMRPDATLVYASTGSLYSRPAPVGAAEEVGESREDDRIVADTNSYDISKFCFDYMAQGFLTKFIGLRLGTVSGYSPNLRQELIFNAMNLSAIRDKRVRLANPKAARSILFLSDLFKVVRVCIDRPDLPDGFYNLASVTQTVGEIARSIARFHDVPVEPIPDTLTYSFRLSTQKARETFGITFDDDIAGQCALFRDIAVRSSAE